MPSYVPIEAFPILLLLPIREKHNGPGNKASDLEAVAKNDVII